ncbi:MAG: outer membrane beta-barrel protein [Campylobacterota bacterium]|nr:outer membrane beta-barrel protein [Campylobacterota bacterium]
MRLLLSLLLATGLYGTSSGIYIEGNIGTSLSKDQEINSSTYEYETGALGSLALGYQMDLWRFEVEGSHKQNNLSAIKANDTYELSGDLIRQSSLLNIYYNGYNSSNLVSAIGLGCGVSNLKTNNLNVSGVSVKDIDANNIFTYQASFSVGYMLDEDWTLSLKYIYFKTSEYEIESVTQKEMSDNIVSLGIRYLF